MLIYQLGKFLLDVSRFTSSPESTMRAYQRKWGDPFSFQIGPKQQVWISGTSAAAQEIFKARPEVFGHLVAAPIEVLLGSRSLLMLEGEDRIREKQFLTPMFHGDNMRSYGDAMCSFTLQEMNTWETNKNYDIHTAMKRITLHVILDAIFGIKEAGLLALFSEKTQRFLNYYSPPLMFLPILRHSFWYPWRRYRKARTDFENVLLESIQKRRQQLDKNDNDILAKLVQFTSPEGHTFDNQSLLDELITLLLGGHETASIALTWALYYTLTQDEIKRKLLLELHSLSNEPTIEEIIKLPYLTAVCKEALRIHPTVPITLRTLKQPFEFQGKQLSPGDTIGLSLTLLHSDASIYREPQLFQPERFLVREYSQYEFAPFSGGARKCLGAAFALYEMRVILATILLNTKLQITSQYKGCPNLYGMTMKPGKVIYGMKMPGSP
jgi:cytochrome P450